MIIGSVSLLLIISAVLTYFLWWQNPKKILLDAVVGVVAAKEYTSTGSTTLSVDGVDVKLEFGGRANDGNYGGEAVLKVRPDGYDKDIEVKVKAVYSSESVFYLRADGIEKIIDDAIDVYVKSTIDSLSDSYYYSYSDADIASIKDTLKSYFDPIIDKVDGKWIKISSKDIEDEDSREEYECTTNVLQKLGNDSKQVKEIIAVYRENDFLFIKNTLFREDGSTGYEIDVSSKEAQEAYEKFEKAVENTEAGKAIKKCSSSDDDDKKDDKSENEGKESDDDTKYKLIVWVNPLSHKLTGVDFEATSEKSKASIKHSQGFSIGQSEKIDIPSDTKDLRDLMGDWKQILANTGYGPTSYDLDYNYDGDNFEYNYNYSYY